MNTPKMLADLKYQDNVLNLPQGRVPETEANRWFHELFNNSAPVKVNRLFVEDNSVVYEAYQDSGSVDYLYIIISN